MSLFIGVLALIGLVAITGSAVRWQLARLSERRNEIDLAAPYRQALHSSVRLQQAAQDMEAEIYAEAIKRAGLGSGAEKSPGA